MKTKNNVQKAGSLTVTFFSVVILTVFPVKAQDFAALSDHIRIEVKSDSGKNFKRDKINSTLMAIAETVVDEPMEIENWMINDRLFNSASLNLAPANEPDMEIEGWMVDEGNFTAKGAIEDKPSVEKKVDLWKVQDEKYGNRKFILTQVSDKKLVIENWMLNNFYW